MAFKGRMHILSNISCVILMMGYCYSQTDKLVQGQELKFGDELVSAFGKFKLGFFGSRYSKDRYIGVWYNINEDRLRAFYDPAPSRKAVWVANPNTPILDESASLRIDNSDGNLKIFHHGGDPIAISSAEGARNTSVTLLQSGNLVLHEIYSNGSIKQELWQSFDYPTDTLLPGMKLGINLQTGHHWFLQSWGSRKSPASGSFTFC